MLKKLGETEYEKLRFKALSITKFSISELEFLYQELSKWKFDVEVVDGQEFNLQVYITRQL